MDESLFPDVDSGGPDAPGLYVAHCDGGSRGNPGPAGFGAVIEDPRGRVVARLSQYLGRRTNNYAEYAGLIAVLKWAVENRARRLRVIADSELMVNQMKGRYKVASPALRPLWDEAKCLARELDRFEIGHTLRGGNKEADRLANEAMDRGMGKKQGPGSRDQESGAPAHLDSAPDPRKTEPLKPARQVFQGRVKNGVVHLIDGELPDGILVKVVSE
jgi:ribonuclease HI